MQTKDIGRIILRVLGWYFGVIIGLNLLAAPMGETIRVYPLLATIVLSIGFAVFCVIKAFLDPVQRWGYVIAAVLVLLAGFPTCYANVLILDTLFTY